MAGDAKRYCAALTSRHRFEVRNSQPEAPKSCEDAFRIERQKDEPEELAAERVALRTADIIDVQVSGDRASGALSQGGRFRSEFKLEKEGEQWLVAEVNLPPGRAN